MFSKVFYVFASFCKFFVFLVVWEFLVVFRVWGVFNNFWWFL